jgi:hypothetical protein
MNDLPLEPRKRSMPEHCASIKTLTGELSEDNRKARATVELDREDTHPDLEFILVDTDGAEISRATIIEVLGPSMTFTLHMRKENVRFPIRLICKLSYLDDQVDSEKEVTINKN